VRYSGSWVLTARGNHSNLNALYYFETHSGRAWVNGFDIVKEPGKVRKSIGIVFQQASVDDLLTGRENLALHNLLFEVPKAVRKQRIDEVLAIVNLEKRADDFVNTYSAACGGAWNLPGDNAPSQDPFP